MGEGICLAIEDHIANWIGADSRLLSALRPFFAAAFEVEVYHGAERLSEERLASDRMNLNAAYGRPVGPAMDALVDKCMSSCRSMVARRIYVVSDERTTYELRPYRCEDGHFNAELRDADEASLRRFLLHNIEPLDFFAIYAEPRGPCDFTAPTHVVASVYDGEGFAWSSRLDAA